MVDVRSDEDSRSRRKSARSPANPAIRIQTLQADLEQAQEEVENLRRENVRLKAALEREIERRKNCEKRAQAGSAELGESQRRCREWEELAGSLRKEVRFLEDVRTNREERVLVSLRERALAEEVQRLRSHLPPPLAALEREVQRLRQLNHSLASDNNALSIAHTTILMRLLHFQKQLSLALTLEHEFRLLRDKYEQLAARERLQRRELDRERRKHHQQQQQQQQQQESNNASKDESRDESDNEELLTISSSSTERVRARQLKLKLEGRRGERKPNGC